ncbi:hypothetical protein ACFVHI_35525 [Kitasatospora sp. NPDC127121]|uniref:hypothetical protein n=1 Tax=Kitasatospora sp. NPDC127121 TaxID=3345371 RepID=UPI0036442F95
MKRSDVVRQHLEDAAAYERAAETATGPAREELLASARDHQALADAARVGEYHVDLED